METSYFIKNYIGYKKLKYRLTPEEYEALLKLRRDGAIAVRISAINKEFWVNTKTIEHDLDLLNQYYSKITKKMLNGNTLLHEALSSAQIEGANTTYADTLKVVEGKAEITNKSELMVMNTYKAIQCLSNIECLDLSKDKLIKLWETITNGVKDNLDIYKNGQYRVGTVHVVDASGSIIHTGVNVAKLNTAMQEVMDMYNRGSKSFNEAVIKSFILHYIFVYIHPFCDGNGRTTRLLNQQYLIQNKLVKFGWFSISSAINKSRTEYYKAIEMSENQYGDITFFVKYMIKAVTNLMFALVKGYNESTNQFNARQISLINLLKKSTGITIKKHAKINNISLGTAYRDVKQLLEMGIIIKTLDNGSLTYRLNNKVIA